MRGWDGMGYERFRCCRRRGRDGCGGVSMGCWLQPLRAYWCVLMILESLIAPLSDFSFSTGRTLDAS
jgi:hypothetical protein